jgi:hypothetical protein
MMEWNESTHRPISDRERFRRRLAYRFRPPAAPPWFNRLQRIIWRAQRLVLGDNRKRKMLRAEMRESRGRS